MPQKKKQADKVDKRYRAKVVIPGLDKPVWVSAKTKRQLEDEKRRVKEEYINGPKREDIPFVDLITEWWERIKKPTIRTPGTLKEWRGAMNHYVLNFFSPKKLTRAVTRSDIQSCLDQTSGHAAATVVRVRSILTSVCRYAVSERLMQIDQSLMLVTPRAKTREYKRSFSRFEEEKILKTASEIGDASKTLIYLLYYLGIRIGEAEGLRWGDILWKKQLVHIQRDVDSSVSPPVLGALKTRTANRYVPIPLPLMEYLQSIRGLPDNYIITGSSSFIAPQKAVSLLRSVMLACGFFDYTDQYRNTPHPGNRVDLIRGIRPWFSAHYFRHHYITSRVQAGDRPEYIMSIVGHASYTTTIQTYTHIQHLMLEDDFKETHLAEVFKSCQKVAKNDLEPSNFIVIT